MYAIDDLLPLSALQHIVFCERQFALIYTEQAWTENRLTVEGKIMHERVHEESRQSRGDVQIDYGVSLRSLRLGLIGKADVVEFHRWPIGSWQPFPVEYKRGKPRWTTVTRSNSVPKRFVWRRCSLAQYRKVLSSTARPGIASTSSLARPCEAKQKRQPAGRTTSLLV